MEALAVKLTGTNGSSIQALSPSDFTFPIPQSERRSALLWWVYGLFAQDARHTIQRLDIPAQFCGEDDLAWLAELLRTHGAPRPELLIADAFDKFVDREAPTHDLWLVVPSGYPVQTQPADDPPASTSAFDQEMRFRVLRDDPTLPFVDVLVPDHGRCWVERTEAVVMEATPLTKWRLDQHAIRSVSFELSSGNEDELRRLYAFMDIFGACVEELRLWRGGGQARASIYNDELAPLTRSCPRLYSLALDEVDVMDISDLFELDQCRVKKLVLSGHHHSFHYGVVLLLDALRPPPDPIGQRLEELSLDVSNYSLAPHEDEFMPLLFLMLKQNHVLKQVHLHVPTSQLAKYSAEFQELRDSVVLVGPEPLSSRHKCALQSVVDRKTECLVEPSVLESVLAFAEQRTPRVVTITETTQEEQMYWDDNVDAL